MNFTFGTKRDNLIENPEFASGIVTGVLIGLAVGILIAPRSGKDLRNKIAGAVSKKSDELSDKWDDVKSEAKKEIGAVKTNVSDSAEKAADKLDKYGNKVADKADDLANKADNKAEELADGTKSTIDKARDAFKVN